ncbi:hypothetical protein 20Sep420_00053 [Pseudomonas phage 20Sep420]|nr:hypothetical protein 20Sep420_00053 [Pseudomonas phage 20Sep420]
MSLMCRLMWLRVSDVMLRVAVSRVKPSVGR